MINITDKPKTIVIPADVFASATTLDELENWLIANDPESISALSEAFKQHLRGETISLEEMRVQLEETN